MKPGYDFTNFAVAKALASPDWSAATLEQVRPHVRDLIAQVSDSSGDPLAEHDFDRLNQQHPTLASALRVRLEGRSQAEVLELLEAVLASISAMSTAASNGRLTTQLKDALVYSSLP